jgi:hypothetical protein
VQAETTLPAETQDTTVQIPDVGAPALAALVQQLIATEPDAEPRIRGGVARLLAGTVHATTTLGVYRVQGAEGRVYETTSGRCDCPDATRRARVCCHAWAITVLHSMAAIASFERAQTRYLLTAKGAAALAALA